MTEYTHVPFDFPSGVQINKLGYEPLRVLMRRDHPLARKKEIDLSDLRDETWIFFPPHIISRTSVEIETSQLGFSPDVPLQPRDYQVIHQLVGAGLGISLLPNMMSLEFGPSVAIRKLRGAELGRTIFIGYREAKQPESVLVLRDALIASYKNASKQANAVLRKSWSLSHT